MAEATNTEITDREYIVATQFQKAVRRVENAKDELNVSSSGYSGDLMWDVDPSDYLVRLEELRERKRRASVEMDIALAEVRLMIAEGAAETWRKVEIERAEARRQAIAARYNERLKEVN